MRSGKISTRRLSACRALTGMGELMKHGCTTCFDHHYVFPAGAGDLIGTQFEAASQLGMRMHCSRGSMDLSVKGGGLPPTPSCRRSTRSWLTPHASLKRITTRRLVPCGRCALAPCSPVLCLGGTSAAERHARAAVPCPPAHPPVRDERRGELYARTRGHAPAGFHADARWVGPDVWYAHGIHFNDEELKLLAETGTGVCHCPASNMKLSSGCTHSGHAEAWRAGRPRC